MILVTGANGYIGQHVVKGLRDDGEAVRAMVRPGIAAEEEKFLRDCGAEILRGDLLNPADAEKVITGADYVVHLVGSIRKPGNEDFMQMHEGRTRALVDALKKSPPKKIIFVSAIGASFRSDSQYQLTKWEAEEVIKKSGLQYVILRSSLVVGKLAGTRDSKLIQRMVDTVKNSPFIPAISHTSGRLQPIFIGDLVAHIKEAIRHPTLLRNTLEVGGPDIVTPVQIMQTIAEVLGLPKKTKVIPFFIARAAVSLAEKFSKNPKMTLEQLNMMRVDNIVRFSSAREYFQISLTPLRAALSYLKNHPNS